MAAECSQVGGRQVGVGPHHRWNGIGSSHCFFSLLLLCRVSSEEGATGPTIKLAREGFTEDPHFPKWDPYLLNSYHHTWLVILSSSSNTRTAC